ncbi:MAG: ABC transporter permease [Chlorobiaceae bacterium]|nr:ABC transporter permease [Chlorobiaceae bacterium]NTW74655.1 ABC transporter permease [Chlorobiaceae bacterium]
MKSANEQKINVLYRFLPGLGLIAAGKRGSGLFYLISSTAFLGLLALRFDLFILSVRSLISSLVLLVLSAGNFRQVFTTELLEFWIAALYIVLVPLLLGTMSLRSYRRALHELNGTSSGELSLWQLGMRSFRKNVIPVTASGVIFILYSVAFLAPFLAPFSPYDQQDFLVTAYQPPLTRIEALVLKQKRASMIPLREGKDDASRLTNALIEDVGKLKSRNRDYSLKFIDSYRVEGQTIRYRQGIRERSLSAAELKNPGSISGQGGSPGITVSRTFLLGTDQYGRDIFSRVIYGSKISLSIGFLVVLISVTLGTVIGVSSGYFGGWTDNILMRLVDVLIAFPALFLILIIIATFGNSIYLIVITLSFTGWMGVARIVRAQVLSLKEQEFILAAKSLGLSNLRIIFRHLVPNALTPVIVAATLRIGSIILTEAGLSFLGLGVQPPTPSWGNIINEGRDSLLNHWWISTFPGLAILSTVVCFNLIGDGVRDALDPRMRN